jgi:hypothetical protein
MSCELQQSNNESFQDFDRLEHQQSNIENFQDFDKLPYF